MEFVLNAGVTVPCNSSDYTVSLNEAGMPFGVTLTSFEEHHLIIPLHDPLQIGALSVILVDVTAHHRLTRDALIARLFG